VERVRAQVATATRVCAYDRAGQGWSDDTDSPRDALGIAADLHALLDQSGERGPYVLVGHSSGGLYVMAYAAQHPAQIAGLVLLDATNPYNPGASLARKAGGGRGPFALLPSLGRAGIGHLLSAAPGTEIDPADAADWQAYETTARAMTNSVDEVSAYPSVFTQAKALTTLGSRPLVVVTTADKAASDAPGYDAQQRFTALSTDSVLRTGDTTHAGLVDDRHGATFSVHAITDVVQAVRTGTPLAQR
jgi:pimeloyl-ACP methyl ester carboxylesterase